MTYGSSEASHLHKPFGTATKETISVRENLAHKEHVGV